MAHYGQVDINEAFYVRKWATKLKDLHLSVLCFLKKAAIKSNYWKTLRIHICFKIKIVKKGSQKVDPVWVLIGLMLYQSIILIYNYTFSIIKKKLASYANFAMG